MPNVILSVLKHKCPRCREGNLFTNTSSYKYKGFFDMPKNCLICTQDFQIETGFYYGAMYVSYALTIAITVAVFTAMIVFDIFTIHHLLFANLIILTLALPYVFRLSRAVWIMLVIKYDPNALKKK